MKTDDEMITEFCRANGIRIINGLGYLRNSILASPAFAEFRQQSEWLENLRILASTDVQEVRKHWSAK